MNGKGNNFSGLITAWLVGGAVMMAQGQNGPFDPEQWPPTINLNLPVHFVVTDGMLWSPGGAWFEGALIIRNDGDQTPPTSLSTDTRAKRPRATISTWPISISRNGPITTPLTSSCKFTAMPPCSITRGSRALLLFNRHPARVAQRAGGTGADRGQ